MIVIKMLRLVSGLLCGPTFGTILGNKRKKEKCSRLDVESCYRNAFIFYWHLKYLIEYSGCFTVPMASLQPYQVLPTETIEVVSAGRSCLPGISWDGEVLTWYAASSTEYIRMKKSNLKKIGLRSCTQMLFLCFISWIREVLQVTENDMH